MNRSREILALVAALLLGAACSGEPTASVTQSGTLVLRLTTPNPDDGGVLFQVSGPPIDTAVAVGGSLRLFTRRMNDSTLVAVVVGSVATGAVVRLRVPDRSAAGRYTARVLEVADRRDALRSSLAGYALTVGADPGSGRR